MSRLGGIGGEPQGRTAVGEGMKLSDLWVILLAAAIIGAVVVVAIFSAGLLSLVSSGGISLPSASTSTTSTTSTSTTSISTTSTVSTTTTESTSTTATNPTTITTSTTSTTLDKYQIASCMSYKVDRIYLGSNPPSKNLELYLGKYYSLFDIMDCKTAEDRKDCNGELEDYLEDNELLWHNNEEADKVGYYPVVVKGRTAYILPTTGAFEDLLACGSLSDARSI